MAVQPAVGRVQHQPPRALRAPGVPAAGFASEYRRIAAPVDEHQALFAPGQATGDRVEERRGESLLERMRAQVHRADCRKPGAGRGALRQLEALVAALAEVVPALE